MPNEDIDVRNLESVEKYRSYTRYLRQAEEAKNKPVWWKTYRGYVEKEDPEHGEEERMSASLAVWNLSAKDFVIVVNLLKLDCLNQPCSVAGSEQVDIGLPYYRPNRTKEVRERKQVMRDKKKNVELERASRLHTCKLKHTHQNGCTQAFYYQANKVVHLFFLSLSLSLCVTS